MSRNISGLRWSTLHCRNHQERRGVLQGKIIYIVHNIEMILLRDKLNRVYIPMWYFSGQRRLEICSHGHGPIIPLDIHHCSLSWISRDHTSSTRSLWHQRSNWRWAFWDRSSNSQTSIREERQARKSIDVCIRKGDWTSILTYSSHNHHQKKLITKK